MKKLSIIIIALLAILVCCKKTPEVNIKYVDVEREVLTIGQTTATFQCDYQYIATLKSAKLYYGIGEATNYVEMRVVQSSLYAELSGLNSGTTYQYYYEFTNGFNSMQSGVKTFVTEMVPISLPTVITADITGITSDSAIGGGEVTNDGGGNVASRGVCWSTSPNPAIEDSFTTDGNGIGSFVSNLTGLSDNTTYHVRAYATNEAGTAYGLDKEFTTLNGGGGGEAPTGAINGLFTINANGGQVYFSQGNLQYQASTNTWRFAEHQWDYVGGIYEGINYGNVYENGVKCDNAFKSSNYNGWIDLYCWATSGYNHGANCYQPWSLSTNPNDYFAYGDINNDLSSQSGKADWGYNAIINGGNTENTWRTLTYSEWFYLNTIRTTESGSRFARAHMNNTNGVILLPDNWNNDNYELIGINNHVPYTSNVISLTDWINIFEENGAVFIPASGRGYGVYYYYPNTEGYYWTETHSTHISGEAHCMHTSENVYSGENAGRGCAFSVRLVQDANE